MSGVSSTGASDVRAILAQNEIRVKRLFASYNPLTGEGSPIERVRLYFTSDSYVLIPVYMAITPTVAAIIAAGGVERYAVAEGIDPGAMCRAVHRLRAVYDFEFWCISCVKIFDKTSGRLVPFRRDGRNSNWYASFFVTYSRKARAYRAAQSPAMGRQYGRADVHGMDTTVPSFGMEQRDRGRRGGSGANDPCDVFAHGPAASGRNMFRSIL